MATTGIFEPQRFEIGRVLSNSFGAIGRNAPIYFGLSFLISGLPQILFQYFFGTSSFERTSATTGVTTSTLTTSSGAFASTGAAGVVFLLYGIVAIALSGLLYAALTRATIEDLSGKRPAVGECLATGLSLLLPVIGISLLVGIAVAVGLVLLLVPGVILWLGWCVAIPVAVQEREGVTGSMSRSWALTKGNRWSLFGLFLIILVIIWVLQIVLTLIAGLVQSIGGNLFFAIVLGLGATFYSILLVTVAAASYIELRRAKEGTGVEELAEFFA